MIDYVDEMCRVWGRQKRRLIGEPAVLQEAVALCLVETRRDAVRGIAPAGNARGISGRLVEEGATGAAITNTRQKTPPEVLTGDALKIGVAIRLALTEHTLSERQYEALFVYYVPKGCLKAKLKPLKISRKAFYERLHRAHLALKPWLDRDTVTGDGVVAAV